MQEENSELKFGFCAQDLIKNGRVDEKDLNKLMVWLRNEQLPKYNEELICLFYMACKNNIEDTKKCAKAYFHTKKEAPELFDNKDLTNCDIRHQLSILEFCVMPQRTKEGYVVVLHRLVDYNPTEYQMDVAMKILFMMMDTTLYSDPPTGLIVLFDMRGVSMRHLTRLKITAVKKFFVYVQEALPLQLIAVHVINCVWFIDKVLALIKPFYNPELLELLHLHKIDMNFEEFYENCIPKSCLPSDLGGNLPNSQELHLQTWKNMEEMQEFFNQEEALRVKN